MELKVKKKWFVVLPFFYVFFPPLLFSRVMVTRMDMEHHDGQVVVLHRLVACFIFFLGKDDGINLSMTRSACFVPCDP